MKNEIRKETKKHRKQKISNYYNFLNKLVTERDVRKVWQQIGRINTNNSFLTPCLGVFDENNVPALSKQEGILNWKKHFENLSNTDRVNDYEYTNEYLNNNFKTTLDKEISHLEIIWNGF